jgi:ABC-2 type transport system ATP-binding protein
VWRKAIPATEVEAYRQRFSVISMRLFAGRTLIHVLSDAKPDAEFDVVAPDLEDLYFEAIRGAGQEAV